MPLPRRVAFIATGFVLLGLLAYSELVLDWRTPNAKQPIRFALTSSSAFLMADYNRLQTEMKERYGEHVSVSVPVTGYAREKTGVAEVSVDGNVLETHSFRRLSEVYGLFVIDSDDLEPIRFPFRLQPDQYRTTLDRSLVKALKDHFKRVPQAWFEFSDTDWVIDRCSTLKSGFGLGMVGGLLRLQEGTSCVVTWKGKQPRSMLVFVGRADGKPWLRPFNERLCRAVTEAGLQRLGAETAYSVNYAACILGDQITEATASKSIFGTVYALAPDHPLARIARIGSGSS